MVNTKLETLEVPPPPSTGGGAVDILIQILIGRLCARKIMGPKLIEFKKKIRCQQIEII